ncbi:MAG: hypothetical protein AAFN07_13980 [Pseudomonadota bacterium]
MRTQPEIGGPDRHDFHDSSLHSVALSPQLDCAEFVLAVPNSCVGASFWRIRFGGVLRIEFETVGVGCAGEFPIDIYDVYAVDDSPELERWKRRFRDLKLGDDLVNAVRHVYLASTFAHGWGRRHDLEGISIVCQRWTISPETVPPDADFAEVSKTPGSPTM